MDIRALRFFVAIAERGNISEVARRLGLTQPALTRHVQRLEEELGVRLLVRHKRGVELTEEGALLAERSRFLLRQVDDIRDEVMSHAGEPAGVVKIGAPPSLGVALFASIAVRAAAEYPRIQPWFAEGLSARMDDALQAGDVDIAFVSTDRVGAGIRAEPLFDEPLNLVSPLDYEPPTPSVCEFDELARLPLVIATGPVGVEVVLNAAAAERGIVLNFKTNADSIYPARNLVRTGLYHAVLPQSAVADETMSATVRARPIKGVTLRRYIAISRWRPMPRAAETMLALVRSEALDWARQNRCDVLP